MVLKIRAKLKTQKDKLKYGVHHRLTNYLHELIENSIAESLPECATCAYLSYCGADPVRNYSEQGDIIGNRTISEICNKNKSIIKHLLSLLKRNDRDVNRVFWSWVTRKSL